MNKFKIGDWVFCYKIDHELDRFVRYALRVENIVFKNEILELSNGIIPDDTVLAHYNMCRKLKITPEKSFMQVLEDSGDWSKRFYTKDDHV